MTEEITKLLYDSLNEEIINNMLNKLNYIANSANKRFSKEELFDLEQRNYAIQNNNLSELSKINYEIQAVHKFLEANKNMDINIIKFVKECLNEIKLLVEQDEYAKTKQLITLIQVTIGITPGFYSELLTLKQLLATNEVVKRKLGENHE